MPEEKTAPAKPAGGSSDDNLFGALAYIIGVIVPLFILFTEKKSNKFLAFHAWQSLIFDVVAIVVWIVVGGGVTVLSIVSSGIGSILYCVFLPLWGVWILAKLYCAYMAYKGEKFKLPALGDFSEKQVK